MGLATTAAVLPQLTASTKRLVQDRKISMVYGLPVLSIIYGLAILSNCCVAFGVKHILQSLHYIVNMHAY